MNRKSFPRVVALYVLVVLVVCTIGIISTPVSVYGDGSEGVPPVKPPTSADSTLDAYNPDTGDDAQNRVNGEAEKSFLEILIIDAAMGVFL